MPDGSPRIRIGNKVLSKKRGMSTKRRPPSGRQKISLLAVVCSLLLVLPSSAWEPHDNKVDYISVKTGKKIEEFSKKYPGMTAKDSSDVFDLASRAVLDTHLFDLQNPKDGKYFPRFLRKMEVKVYSPAGKPKCDAPAEAVSLRTGTDEKKEETLYAYSYLVCSGSTQVAPVRMLDKYIEKYGNYDERNWTREQYVYYKVKGHFKLLVKALEDETKSGALLITVIDEEVFNRSYTDARARVRKAEAKAAGKL